MLLLLLCVAAAMKGTVYVDNGVYSLSLGKVDKGGVAYGSFADDLEKTGWGFLELATNSKFPDGQQMHAIGYLEGALTARRIYQHSRNMNYEFFGNNTPDQKTLDWMAEQDAWARAQIKSNPTIPFWSAAGLVLAQFDGLVDGYTSHHAVGETLDVAAFRILNGVGDLLDLRNALHPELRPKWDEMTPKEILREAAFQGHCSGLIKVTPDYSDILMAHSSWFTYGAMNRIMKIYHFAVSNPHVASKTTAFSSYPGFLESLDDFYLMGDSNLVMVQTTNNVFNKTLYDLITPKSMLAWQRVRIANFIATSGREWYKAVSEANSGTYNNQYMVVDLKLFEPGKMLKPDTLWVMEQIPGRVEGKDTTQMLEFGYFPSYNVPYFKSIWEESGYGDMVRKTGNQDLTWDLAPRAKIFRRDSTSVYDIPTLQHMMRYNDYKNDPLSQGNPMNAICSRGDLESDHPRPGGCYDSKVANLSMALALTISAQNGPTHQGQPPFQWVKAMASQPDEIVHLQFVSPPSDILKCPICQDVFHEAVIARCCHSFDRYCIAEAIGHAALCPLCRKPVSMEALTPNLVVQQLVDSLPVYCPFRIQGCSQEIPRGALESHASSCVFALKECPHKKRGCDWKPALENDLKNHLSACPYEVLKLFIERLEAENVHLQATVREQAVELEQMRLLMQATPAMGDKVPSSGTSPPRQAVTAATPLVEEQRWQPDSLKCHYTLTGHERPVTSLCVGAEYLYSGSQDSSVRVWDLNTFELVKTLTGHQFSVWAIVENGDYLYTASSDCSIRVWHRKELRLVSVVEAHVASKGKVFTLEACEIAGALRLYSGASDCKIKVWDISSAGEPRLLDTVEGAHRSTISSLRACEGRDGESGLLVSASWDKIIKVWRLPTMECLHEIEVADQVYSLAVAPPFIYAGADRKVKVIDMNGFMEIASLESHKWEIWQLTIGGGFLVSGSHDHKIKLWDPQSFACVGTLHGHSGYIHALACWDQFLFSASGDRTIKVWTSRTRRGSGPPNVD